MTAVLELAREVLQNSSYTVIPSGESDHSLHFEDDAVLGLVHFFETIQELLEAWESIQDSFLRRVAKQLRMEPTKAWNAYTVLLCSESCPEALRKSLEAVEEDFRGTRKIAYDGVRTLQDVEQALLPLLPIQAVAVLKLEDPLLRLRSRLYDSLPRVFDGLVGETPPQVLAEWLIEAK